VLKIPSDIEPPLMAFYLRKVVIDGMAYQLPSSWQLTSHVIKGENYSRKYGDSKLVENAISVFAEKVMAPLPILKFNPGFGSFNL
jgi:hypothetical protein